MFLFAVKACEQVEGKVKCRINSRNILRNVRGEDFPSFSQHKLPISSN
jgi:hypothetical protein